MKQKLLKKVEALTEEQAERVYPVVLIFTDDEAIYTEGYLEKPEPEPPKEEPPEPEEFVSRYDKNETMRLIGYQNGFIFAEREKEIKDIITAYDMQGFFYNNTLNMFEIMMDTFSLGVIYGKRMLRQKKKAAYSTTK